VEVDEDGDVKFDGDDGETAGPKQAVVTRAQPPVVSNDGDGGPDGDTEMVVAPRAAFQPKPLIPSAARATEPRPVVSRPHRLAPATESGEKICVIIVHSAQA
jgi:hypothetical protein